MTRKRTASVSEHQGTARLTYEVHPFIRVGFDYRVTHHGTADAGYDHVCVHQVGKDQKGFFEFYEREILPELKTMRPGRRAAAGAARRKSR